MDPTGTTTTWPRVYPKIDMPPCFRKYFNKDCWSNCTRAEQDCIKAGVSKGDCAEMRAACAKYCDSGKKPVYGDEPPGITAYSILAVPTAIALGQYKGPRRELVRLIGAGIAVASIAIDIKSGIDTINASKETQDSTNICKKFRTRTMPWVREGKSKNGTGEGYKDVGIFGPGYWADDMQKSWREASGFWTTTKRGTTHIFVLRDGRWQEGEIPAGGGGDRRIYDDELLGIRWCLKASMAQ